MQSNLKHRDRATRRSSTPAADSSNNTFRIKDTLRRTPGFEQQAALLSPVQAKDATEGTVHDLAEAGTVGSGGALPFYDQIQASFGHHDVSHVQAYTGGAAQLASEGMGAEAYATGDKIVFGNSPTLHTAAHEAAHAIQQRGGVNLKDGVGEAGDRYEQHADAVADLVVQGKSAEGLLDAYTGNLSSEGATQQKAIQRVDSDVNPEALMCDNVLEDDLVCEASLATVAAPTVKEVSNTISDPPYGWTSAYQVTITGNEIKLLMKVKINPQEGVTATQVKDVKARAEEGVSTYLDNKFAFTDDASGTSYALRVAVEFVETAQHLTVKLHPGNSGANLVNWYVERPTATLAHELAHQLGLKDEYISPRVPNRKDANAPGVYTDHSLMGNFVLEGADQAQLHERHGRAIADDVGSVTSRTFTVTRN